MHDILDAWAWDTEPQAAPAESGLINQSFIVTDRFGTPLGVVQRLNTAIFSPLVHEDIDAVTAHLAEKGLPTPRLVPTREGRLWLTTPSGEVWRRLTWIGDRTVEKLADPHDAESAGGLVARFHAATADLDWRFRSVRGGFHDTDLRMAQLREALVNFPAHRLYDRVARLAEGLFAAWEDVPRAKNLPERVIHGDLKISNVRFGPEGALALIDLDTMGHGTVDAELGDAFRSWCNPSSESDAEASFDLELFAAGIRGYASGAGGALTEAEWAAIVPGVARITLELSARFAADALAEAYFGWNPIYGGRGEHNLLRADGQWSLAQAVLRATDAATRAVETARAESAAI